MTSKFDQIKKNLASTYDGLADYWGIDKTLHDWGEEHLVDFARRVKKSGNRNVLDLGCASGYQSKILADLKLSVVGLDLSSKMIKNARKKVPNAKFVVGDMTKMPFKASQFAGVYARASLLHVPKNLVPRVLADVNRILASSGLFYLAIKEGDFEGNVKDVRHGVDVDRFFSFFGVQEIRKLLKDAKFSILELSKYRRKGGSTTWIQILAKKIN